jgi:hypothetical protein
MSNGTINLKHLIVVPHLVESVHRDQKKVRHFLRPKMEGTTGSYRLRDPFETDWESRTDVLNRPGRVGTERVCCSPFARSY